MPDIKQFNFTEGEILLVNKPLGWTSFDVVNKIRGTIGQKKLKVGHAGTLDPLATGLLIIATGPNTKRLQTWQDEDKEYTGEICLGGTTPSYDLETEVQAVADPSHLSPEDISKATEQLTGVISQIAPPHSAKKIDGVRAYTLARAGEEVNIKPREVTIHTFAITKNKLPVLSFIINCTKGTYIRSMAHDLGQILGCGAHLQSLCRTQSGGFHLNDAWELSTLLQQIQQQKEKKVQ